MHPRNEVAVSIPSDLHAGQVGKGFLGLLAKVVHVQLRRLPGTLAGRSLTQDDFDEAMQEFLAQRRDRTIAALLTQASDDESMERLLHTIVYHWRIDEIRKTDRGSVRRRLHEHLAQVREFEQAPAGEPGTGWWQLAGTAAPPWGGRIENLVSAAHTVRAAAVP